MSRICGDKLLTSVALNEAGVAQPEVRVAFTKNSAIDAMEELGYPVVLKPAVGSWGRLLSKVNDRDAVESILEHKTVLGSYHHSIFYIQKHAAKGRARYRSFVVSDECIAAIYRESEYWITNMARRQGIRCPITAAAEISLAAAAVGGGAAAADFLKPKKVCRSTK